jgi:hypothetical protein
LKERGRERKKQKERKGEATASARQNCVDRKHRPADSPLLDNQRSSADSAVATAVKACPARAGMRASDQLQPVIAAAK